jgi:hypothetical protein
MAFTGATAFLRIAEITIGVRYADRGLWRALREPVSRFAVRDAETVDVLLDIDRMDGGLDRSLLAPSRLLFDSGSVWRLHAIDSGYRLDCHAQIFGERPYKSALFDSAFSRGRILVRSEVMSEEMHPLDHPLDEVLIANLLGRGRGVELHGCGVIDHDGRGHLFVGQSGAGKTTTARVWLDEEGIEVVSDDRVIVRDCNGTLRMFGTPWHGEAELSSAASAPLAGVYLLRQAPTTELMAMTPADTTASLFGCTFPLFHDADALAFTLGFLDRMTREVPVHALRFRPDASVIDTVRRAA